GVPTVVHPLVHENISDFTEQRFRSTFTGEEFFLADHVVNGQRILPAVAYLEMARAAVERSSKRNQSREIRLTDVAWMRPLIVDSGPINVMISLCPENDEEISYEIYSETEDDDAGRIVHARGMAAFVRYDHTPRLDITYLQNQCGQYILDSKECYRILAQMGLDYGPGHQGIKQLFVCKNQVLAKLFISSSAASDANRYILNPGLLDAALQAAVGMQKNRVGETIFTPGSDICKPALPFALKEFEIYGACRSEMWAYIRYSEGCGENDRVQKLDIDLCDEQGRVCVRLKGYSPRVLDNAELGTVTPAPTRGSLILKPDWKRGTLTEGSTVFSVDERLVVLCVPIGENWGRSESLLGGVRCINLEMDAGAAVESFQTGASRVFDEIRHVLGRRSKQKTLFQIIVSGQNDYWLFSGLSGMLKTAGLENPNFIGQVIEVNPEEDLEAITRKLEECKLQPYEQHVRYIDGVRCVQGWSRVEPPLHEPVSPWKDSGVYLITGGAGGLGLQFARDAAERAPGARLILAGRSAPSLEQEHILQEMRGLGATVVYKQVDVTDERAVERLVQNIQTEYGGLHGIIHCAGFIKDNYILKKTAEELRLVMAPKVAGAVYLDHTTRHMDLDFFVLCSSIAGSLGNPGQADYSAANAFMDVFAEQRNQRVASKERHGRTVSVNWPIWKEGGMNVDSATQQALTERTGMLAMETSTGIRSLYMAIASGESRLMVMEGELDRLRQIFLGDISLNPQKAVDAEAQRTEFLVYSGETISEKAVSFFKKLLSSVIKLPANRIEADAPMEKYGIDSIMVMQLTGELEKVFGTLPKTLWFEYRNIRELTGYFLELYPDEINKLLGTVPEMEAAFPAFRHVPQHAESSKVVRKSGRRFDRTRGYESEIKAAEEEIAIIGVAGRYPGAQNLDQYWEVLRDGKDCITEIPRDRWDAEFYYDRNKGKAGKTNSKWGGFLDDIDCFDPLFFNISPWEAERMDPQERLFLQCVYETLEDAGYTRFTLGQREGSGGSVGVFVGVMYEEYQLYGVEETAQGRPVALSGNPSSIANRVSYFCNFNGPSIAVDTMCSSSLTAIHFACQSIQRGDCETAIAGGVNLSLHPNKYLLLGQGNFASSKGRCESFGEGGDGYVPGEGVGAVLLKPLSKAIADGDQIYAVIKGSAINHGGKTNGYYVPNLHAQAGVIGRVLERSGINPRAISYIEAHGTGTSLGDPIELAGLTKTFETYTRDRQFCALGSAKSNIGHCESASGIAGLTKVLLQIKYRKLVPSLHSKVLNSNIDFSRTPFVVQQDLTEWKRPIIEMHGETTVFPRIAGISSFGAGGANAHIILSEYVAEEPETANEGGAFQQQYVVLLSAKNRERLQEQASNLLDAIRRKRQEDLSLADMAYTLQVGREAMEERIAFIVGSAGELEEKLQQFLDGKEEIENLIQGRIKRDKEEVELFAADDDLKQAVTAWLNKRKYRNILNLWVKGLEVDWNRLYFDIKPRRISLPAYPFAKERCWLPKSGPGSALDTHIFEAPSYVHPLLQLNCSDFSEQRFSSTFTGREYYLLDDETGSGKRFFPHGAYFEMVAAAVNYSLGELKEEEPQIRLHRLILHQPISVEFDSVTVEISLTPEEDGTISFNIFSRNGKDCVVYCEGIAELDLKVNTVCLNLQQLEADCGSMSVKSPKSEYSRSLSEAGQLLVQLSVPDSLAAAEQGDWQMDSLQLHEVMLMQSYLTDNGSSARQKQSVLSLPFTLQELEILGRCT
ncbi:SDR family NAD(P)-dependent oxidoreductase, partial [Paenibacillus forsythiae]